MDDKSQTQLLADAIRKHRKARHWSANTLSLKAGLSASYVALLESGRSTRPSVQVVAQIAAALDVPMDDIVRDMGLPLAVSAASHNRVTEIWQQLHGPSRRTYLDIGESLMALQDAYEDEPHSRMAASDPAQLVIAELED